MAYFCNEHQVEWKRTKKGNFSHPIKAGSEMQGWCNMPEGTGPTEPPVVTEAKNMGAVVINAKDASIARAVAFKGAIALASSGKIELKDIGAYAKKFSPWLDTGA